MRFRKSVCAMAVVVAIPFVIQAETEVHSIVPKPVKSVYSEGRFTLDASTKIVVGRGCLRKGKQLAGLLSPATGFDLGVTSAKVVTNFISLELVPDDRVNGEGYKLAVSCSGVSLKAGTEAGLFYGFQSLLQLLPAKIYAKMRQKGVSWTLPCVQIEDKPSYKWRGMMLDVSRYFLDKAFMFQYLDMMAMHKMNALHWHLIDDCGWRVEIKKYPKLTTVGAFRGEGVNRYGGFYTQEEIKEIVKYASDRHITIIPEIELPAHTLSAIVAYPELSCTGKPHKLPDYHFISRDLYCAGKENTWRFLEDVFTEVLELFPGEYIHIGGDEANYARWKKCPYCQSKMKVLGLKNEKQLQGWMTTQVEKMLQAHGRRLIGWDEILQCGVSRKAGLMPWHNPKAAVIGAKRGNPIVLSLTRHAYFDAPESRLPGELPGATWIPPVTMRNAYNWEPRPNGLTDEQARHILGASGCLWTDQLLHKKYLRNVDGFNESRAERYVEYFSLPRMAALAEVTWTPKRVRDFSDFMPRMGRQYNRYAAAGYHYRLPVPTVVATLTSNGVNMSVSTDVEGGLIRYTTDGSYPHLHSPIYSKPVWVQKKENFKAMVVAPDGKHHSLTAEFKTKTGKYAKYGKLIGKWKSGKVGNGKAKIVAFDATGKVNEKGHYLVTFIYTKGEQRLDIDGIRLFKNRDEVAKNIRHGFAGGASKDNSYRLMVPEYETGAAYTIKAAIYGDTGSDSNGMVFIKKMK